MPNIADPPAIPTRKRRRYRPRTRLPEPVRRFDFLKAMANFEGALEECPRKECRKRHQCCGGPRGGLRWHGGIPFCRSQAIVERAALADKHGDPGRRKHGEGWAAEKLAGFRNATGRSLEPTADVVGARAQPERPAARHLACSMGRLDRPIQPAGQYPDRPVEPTDGEMKDPAAHQVAGAAARVSKPDDLSARAADLRARVQALVERYERRKPQT